MRCRFKDVLTQRCEKLDYNGDAYIGLENITSWDSRFIKTEISPEGTCSKFYAGDVLFGKLRPYLAKGYIPSNDGVCSTEFLVLATSSSLSNKFLLYYILSHDNIDYIKNQVAGVKMPRTNWESLAKLELDIPSLSEQSRIVSYLDAKTSAIDSRISILEQKCEAYERLKKSIINDVITRGLNPNVKMQDYDEPMMGVKPTHWQVYRLKDLASYINGYAFKPSEWSNCGMPIIRIQNLNDKDALFNYYEGTLSDELLIKKGDMLISWSASLGTYIWNGPDAYLNQHIFKVVFDKIKINKDFFNYVISKCLDSLSMLSHGSTMMHIQRKDFDNAKAFVPPFEEQVAIAHYLQERCAKIDSAISILNAQIDKYKLLKRSLINEVITGQRKVD